MQEANRLTTALIMPYLGSTYFLLPLKFYSSEYKFNFMLISHLSIIYNKLTIWFKQIDLMRFLYALHCLILTQHSELNNT